MTIRFANLRPHAPRRVRRQAAWGALALLGSTLFSHPATSAEPKSLAPARLVYARNSGDQQRYEVLAFFHGHIPPFAKPGSEPINLKAKLQYVASVVKRTPDGVCEVRFRVDKADLSVLAKEPGPDGKIDADDELPFPIAESDIHKALDVVATLRPDGSIVRIVGGDPKQDKINIGFELRKLFLLTMPVTFPARAVKPQDSWRFADGVLGRRPDYVTYQARLDSVATTSGTGTYSVGLNAENNVSDLRDKDGKPTSDAGSAVDVTTGKVTVTGQVQYVGDKTGPANGIKATGRAVHVGKATLTMNALIHRKKSVADPEHPEDPLESDIDVRARLSVRVLNATAKSAKPIKSASR